jgi:phosphonate transport system permease protein
MSMPTQSQPTSIRRPSRKKFWFTFMTVSSVLTFLYAVALIQIDLSVQLQQNALRMLERLIIGPFTHEKALSRIPEFSMAMVETVAIAYAGVLVGSILAIPLGFLAAKNLVGPLALLGKGILNGIRAFPELLFAIIFVATVGMGPYAGVLAITINCMGMLGKLYSEVVESIDMTVLEALRASGANKIQVLWYGVLPQVIPEFSSYAIYRFEIDVRSASILGLVGAGGIGAPLLIASNSRSWEEVGMIIFIIVIVVTLVDYLSMYIRKRIA